LDLKLREAMQIELRRLQQELGITTIFVTHDQGEAMSMSDRIAVMNLGRIEQIGTAEAIYAAPNSRFVASFVGQINLLEGTIIESVAGYCTLDIRHGPSLRVRSDKVLTKGSKCAIAIRPEKLRLISALGSRNGLNIVDGQVAARSFAGSSVKLLVEIGPERR